MSFAPIIFTEFDAAKRKQCALFALIAGLSLAFLTGCGGAWQPDPRDGPQSPARSSVESSGITGPNDSR
jgi:hypothetical protein